MSAGFLLFALGHYKKWTYHGCKWINEVIAGKQGYFLFCEPYAKYYLETPSLPNYNRAIPNPLDDPQKCLNFLQFTSKTQNSHNKLSY